MNRRSSFSNGRNIRMRCVLFRLSSGSKRHPYRDRSPGLRAGSTPSFCAASSLSGRRGQTPPPALYCRSAQWRGQEPAAPRPPLAPPRWLSCPRAHVQSQASDGLPCCSSVQRKPQQRLLAVKTVSNSCSAPHRACRIDNRLAPVGPPRVSPSLDRYCAWASFSSNSRFSPVTRPFL
jgi:hypothetical protein